MAIGSVLTKKNKCSIHVCSQKQALEFLTENFVLTFTVICLFSGIFW